MKPVHLRQIAEDDIRKAFVHYLQEAGADVAADFVTAVDDALSHIENHPGSGSPRYSQWLDIAHLRSWMLARFPYVAIYIEHETYLDVVRVLHQHSDIPAQLQEG